MKGTVDIGGVAIEMVANAASPYIYRQIFHEDFIKEAQKDEPDADLFAKMGFVMAKQATTSKMSDLMNTTVEEYYEWLTQFEPLAVLTAAGDISNLYMGQEQSLSVPKNEGV